MNGWASVAILVEDGIDVIRKLDELGTVNSFAQIRPAAGTATS